MTRGKCKEVLQALWRYKDCGYSENEIRESLDMAIKALEQESILDNCIEIPKDATNGDVFVAVWGYAPSHLRVYADWWNAPYKKGDIEDDSN